MEIAEIRQLIRLGKPKLILHALFEWEKSFPNEPEPLIDVLKCENQEVLEVAFIFAAKIQPLACAPFVINHLKNSNHTIRRLAVQALVPEMGKSVFEALRSLLRSEKNEYVLASAVTAAARLNQPIQIIQEFLKHKDIRVRANTVRAIAKIGCAKLRELIEPCLKDKALRVQNEAIKALLGMIPNSDLEALLRKRLKSPEVSVRASTAFLIGELEIPQRIQLLTIAMGDNELSVRLCAGRAILATNDPDGISFVLESYFEKDDYEFSAGIRMDILKLPVNFIKSAIEELGEPETIDFKRAKLVLNLIQKIPDKEPFLHWIIASTGRNEVELRKIGFLIVAEKIEFFQSRLDSLLEKADRFAAPDDKAMANYVRWKAGNTLGLENLKEMVNSGKPVMIRAAYEILSIDKSLIAREIISEAKKSGYIASVETKPEDKDSDLLKPIKLPKF